MVKGQFRKEEEPGIQFITLVKGGEKAENGFEDMLEIVSIPLASANSPSGREFAFLGAFIDIIQNYALKSMESDLNAYSGLGSYVSDLSKAKDKKLVFAEEDLGEGYDENNLKSLFGSNFEVMDCDDADQLISDHADGVVVSYVVAPTNPSNGSFCYKMLIDPSTHDLFFYKKHRITKKMGAVFLQEDLKRIALSRKL